MKRPLFVIAILMTVSVSAQAQETEIRQEFYPNGQVQYERSYKNGKSHGLTKMFSQDGTLMQDVVYVNGRKEGLWREYYPSGALKETRIYKNDKVNGIAVRYFENGKPEREMMWVNNIPDGNIYRKFYDYDENEELINIREYKDGKFVQSDALLIKDDDYPLMGVWKSDCANDFGLTIDKSDNRRYSLMFCGPSGCMPEEFWLKSTIVNDERFKVIDADHFEMISEGQVIPYRRCSR
jgi:hypothetical protein